MAIMAGLDLTHSVTVLDTLHEEHTPCNYFSKLEEVYAHNTGAGHGAYLSIF